MKKSFMKILVSLCFATLPFISQSCFSMPACNIPRDYTQPDGSVIQIYNYGDENYSFIGDSEGYLLRKNELGAYEYVTNNSTGYFSSSFDKRPANAVKGFDLMETQPQHTTEFCGIEKSTPVFFSSSLENSAKTVYETKLLVIAVDFTDVKLSDTYHSPEKISNSFFDTSENAVSVRNYYNEVSGGRQIFAPAFTLGDNETYEDDYGKVADGVVKVLIDSPHPNPQQYGNATTNWTNAVKGIVKSAIEKVDEYIDFSEFNIDTRADLDTGAQYIHNGELTICFVIAGFEASAAGEDTNSVWSHRTRINDSNFIFDGVVLLGVTAVDEGNDMYSIQNGDYIMTGAMYNSSNAMGIGLYCHELGHTLGLPDLYNTSGSTQYADVYTLSLMASGNWCAKDSDSVPSSMPSYIDPWCKWQLGWYDEDEILEIRYDEALTTNLVSYLSEKEGYKLIILRTADEGEYYIIENREFKGFDVSLKFCGSLSLKYPGIAIWQIDEDVLREVVETVTLPDGRVIEYNRFETNKINCTSTPGIKLLRSEKDFENFYNKYSPLWFKSVNKMPCFGSLSQPSNALNTKHNQITDSGVEIDFLSSYSDSMALEFGNSDTDIAMFLNNSNVNVFAFNDTDKDISFTPIVAQYDFIQKLNSNKLKSAVILPKITASANSSNSASALGTFSTSNPVRLFTWNMNNFSPFKN